MEGTESKTMAAVTNQVNELGKAVGVLEETVGQMRDRLTSITRPIDTSPMPEKKLVEKPLSSSMTNDIAEYVRRLNIQIESLRQAIGHLEI